MNSIQLVIFDMDGLMFDTEKTYFDAHINDFKQLNLKYNADAFMKSVGTSAPLDIKHINQSSLSDEEFAQILSTSYNNAVENMIENGVPLKKGLFELLNKIDSKKLPMVVATSTPIEISGRLLKKAGVFDRFKYVVTAKDVKHGKPAPDIFLKACDMCHIRPENALVLEDSEAGCLAAYAASIPYIVVPDMKQPPEEVKKHALLVADSLFDVIGILK